MKTKFNSIAKLATLAFTSLVAIALFITACSKDDTVTPITNGTSSGSDLIDMRTGGPWTIDKVHSNVGWSTLYYGDNAYLTGRFNMFDMTVYFDEANPANSTVKAWVQLSTFNTGEPGRDGYGHCGPGYMGVLFDTISASPVTLAPRATTDTAWFTSTHFARYGTGYMVTGDLNFRQVTKPVSMYLTYEGQSTFTSGTTTTYRLGFTGQFTIKAKTDFGIVSNSIGDDVTITVNCNAKKN